MIFLKNPEYSFDMTLIERERYVKTLWECYNHICDSVKDEGWFKYLKDYLKPKMIPIQRVVRAPKFKSYKYTPRQYIRYCVTDPTSKIVSAYLLTPPKTLY